MQSFPSYHYELLNEIHGSRAFRQLVGKHTFTKPELDGISKSVGDMPTWDRAKQPALVAATLETMASLWPYVDEEA
jgi:hypothetical protein